MIDLLDEADEIIKDRDSRIEELEKNLKEKLEMLDESDERNDELKTQLYLANKTLPSLPKKQNAFQKLGSKMKTKFQRFVEKTKAQKQELIAKIEVKIK